MVWIDPTELEGFPQDLIWVLRAHPNDIIDLHVGEFSITEGDIELNVQRGRYRLSGARIAIHPVVADEERGVVLSRVTNQTTGQTLETSNGEVLVNIRGPATYRLAFTPII
jgi:hypothetical protein